MLRIESIDLFVRETPPTRMPIVLGRSASGTPPANETNPLAHVRLVLSDSEGRQAWGCSGDRLSVRWLDKRPDRSEGRKIRELATLVEQARTIYLEQGAFRWPFDAWYPAHHEVYETGHAADQEDLTCAFASALIERALIDAACRLEGRSLFQMVRQNRLGVDPARVHRELAGFNYPAHLPRQPATRFYVRHTIGLLDPLEPADQPPGTRLDDGLPETLAEYVRDNGIRFFKVKTSGDVDFDLERLARIWDLLAAEQDPGITLDANEAFTDLDTFAEFVDRMARELPGLFDHLLFIEQPLDRSLSLADEVRAGLATINRRKPVIIDESDATLDAFRCALELGYAGTSHKNCKGVFKSLVNHALMLAWRASDRPTLLSAEDLQNLPIVPLQQDFATLGVLGVEHCERNGHHYNRGLSMLSPRELRDAQRFHTDLYEQVDGLWRLRIADGAVECGSLQVRGFGVRTEPDFASMVPLRQWVDTAYPAAGG